MLLFFFQESNVTLQDMAMKINVSIIIVIIVIVIVIVITILIAKKCHEFSRAELSPRFWCPGRIDH